MIDRAFLGLLVFASGIACAEPVGKAYPIADGMARLTIERSEEPLLYRQDAMIGLNGRPTATLTRGARLQVELAPGTWRISAKTRPTAEQSVLALTLLPNREYRVRVELDAARFPPERSVFGLTDLLRQSLDAPNDDRVPLFTLRQVIEETPEGDR